MTAETAAGLHPDDVLTFWFADGRPPPAPRMQWFRQDPAFDAAIRGRFANTVEAALAGAFAPWAEAGPDGALALVLLLDQFPRNLFRDSPRGYAGDARARAVAESALERGWDRRLSPIEAWFLYLPLMHAEDPVAQGRMLAIYESLPPHPGHRMARDSARQHRNIVARFGRFPHRNAILGRASTDEEAAFLATQGRGF